MGNKKKRYQQVPPDGPSQDMKAEEDPYWQVSTVHRDPSKGGRASSQFHKFIIRYPGWADDIFSGLPTYYGILGVLRGASPEHLLHNYKQEMIFSCFQDETVERAYQTLSDTRLRIKYDEFLQLFKVVTEYTPSEIIDDIRSSHDKYLKRAIQFRRLRNSLERFSDYVTLSAKGLPSIFEYSGLLPESDEGEIAAYGKEDNELARVISSLLLDPHTREEFAYISEFYTEMYRDEEKKKVLEEFKKVWTSIHPALLYRVMLTVLTTSQGYDEIVETVIDNLNDNHDWIPYLPPSKETFFTVLGVDETVASLPKPEIESLLRSQYRRCDRTVQVNLAYTVLKNSSLREKYLWMREYYEFKALDMTLNPPVKRVIDTRAMEKLIEQMARTMLPPGKNQFLPPGLGFGDNPFSRFL